MARESGCVRYGGVLQAVTVRGAGTRETRVASNLARPPRVGLWPPMLRAEGARGTPLYRHH